MKDNYWQKLVDKHLVGRKIVKVKWLDQKETDRLFGWDMQPCEIHLDNGTVLTPSMDDEGNDAGAIFTNVTELPVIPTFRDYIFWAIGNSDRPFFLFGWAPPTCSSLGQGGPRPQAPLCLDNLELKKNNLFVDFNYRI